MSVPTDVRVNRSRMALTIEVTGWFSAKAHRAGHGVGGHEGRADEGQEDERVGERAGAVGGLGGEPGDDGQPGQGRGEQDRDAGDREPGQHPAPERKPEQGGAHDDHHQGPGWRSARSARGPTAPTAGRWAGLEAFEDAALQVGEEPGGVGDARGDRDEQDAGQQVVQRI